MWIDGRSLGRFLAEDLGSYYVSLSASDFHIAHPFKPERVKTEQDPKYKLHYDADICS